ncbi:hypothetical protein EXN66_Car013638 [Channa argus]|uniref:SEA domain-containing protein n=1 Tax=Channa argus TaxID=215402 RepID=A0A6G1Q622_CHAAH|nr:hypothetical protein EXN66_Car013638 [Channa argus]
MGSGQVLMSLLILIVAFELSTKPVTAQANPDPTTTTTAPTTTTTTTPVPTTTTTTPLSTTTTTPVPTTTTTAAGATAAPTTTTTAAPTTTTTAAPTTTTTAATTTPQPLSTTQMSFKTKDIFKSELLNLSSPEAKARTSNIISQLGPYYRSAFSAFSTMDVIGYSNGSIKNSLTLAFSSGSVPNPNEIAKVLVAAAANITELGIDITTISVNGTATSSGISHRISIITASCLVLLSWLLTNRQ